MKDFIKKHWQALLSVLGTIIGLLFLRDFFQKDLKAKLNNAKTDQEDAVLNEKKNQASDAVKTLEDQNKALSDDLKKNPDNLKPNEVVDYWNKDKK